MATTYRAGQVAALLGVSPDTVPPVGRQRPPRDAPDAGRAAPDRRPLAGPVPDRDRGRVPELEPVVGQSARNRFPGVVTRVEKDRLVALVEIQAGPHRVVSLMTREAADELGLELGDLAVAAVKSTNVVVEVTGSE